MNEATKNLLSQINTKTKEVPLIYFSREIERALGLELLLENYYIVCIEKSYITQQLYKLMPGRIFCTEIEGIQLENKSTLELINHIQVQEWVKKVAANGKFYAQLFQFNAPTYLKLQNLGGIILNNKAELNRMFEDKISQLKILSANNISIPKSEIINISEINYAQLIEKFGNKFVIQLDRAHTGTGTFIIESESEFNEFKTKYEGNIVRTSQFIDGQPYTINACITKNGVFIQGLQYQITGYSELTSGKGSTIGNDWSFANSLPDEVKSKIFGVTKRIGELMGVSGFRGIFGLDLIVKDNEIFIIEINARQTANIALQTKLELRADQTPLAIIHLSEFMEVQILENPASNIQPLDGSQIFLRAKEDNFKINNEFPSGIYRFESNNSELKWQNDGYSIDQIKDDGFVLNIQSKNEVRNKFEEVARMQFTNQIVYNNKVNSWIIEALVNIERLLK